MTKMRLTSLEFLTNPLLNAALIYILFIIIYIVPTQANIYNGIWKTAKSKYKHTCIIFLHVSCYHPNSPKAFHDYRRKKSSGWGERKKNPICWLFLLNNYFLFQISRLFFVMQIAETNENGSRKDIISTESLENIPRRITLPITLYSLLSIITGLKMDCEWCPN